MNEISQTVKKIEKVLREIKNGSDGGMWAIQLQVLAIQLRILVENKEKRYYKPEWRDIIRQSVEQWAKKHGLQYWFIC